LSGRLSISSRATGIGFVLALIAACDPVHDDAIDALGGEAPGVRKGPLHRPGQPCLLCHDGAIGSPREFSVAGTVYLTAIDLQPTDGAVVALADANGTTFKATTNAAGNFYVTPSEWTPIYPMKVAITHKRTTVNMKARIGRDGSCAACHSDPPGPTSAGRVVISSDGGVP
jgi:hypothetical protein